MRIRKKKPSKIRQLSFEYLGEPVQIEYNIIKANKAFNRVRDRLYSEDVNEQRQAMSIALAGSITKWSLADEDDNILPIKVESFDFYSGSLINMIFDEIRFDVQNLAERSKKRR